MKKAIIIGCPGSGKSTFGRRLKQITGLPLYHLDMMYWNEDRTTVSKEVFLNRLKAVMNQPSWIIDGNYGSTMEMRMKECDTVFFLDYPTDVCIEGIEARKGKPRSDMPWINNDGTDKDFVAFVKNYNRESRPKVMNLLERYASKNIILFRTRTESEQYLLLLEKKGKE
ncbi:MAG: adenylate kinase [Ruminococcaceae bacterium]|nr:adenylate kinase [Oscillospiraceae bacterium]